MYNFGKTILKYLFLIVFIPVTIYSQISVSPSFIKFGELGINSQNDTTITITSEIDDVLQSFDFKFGSPFYSIVEQLPISLKKDEPKSLTIRYIPNDSVKSYTEYELKTNEQSIEIGFLGGYKYQDTVIEATTITSPTKGDYYLYQDEIVINWTKVPGFDRYIIQFLANNGAGWSTITDSAIGTSYIWKAPHLNSDKCLIRIETYFKPESKFFEHEWDKSFGISKNDNSHKLIQTSDGGYLTVGSTRGKDSSTSKKLFDDILVCKMNKDGEQLWTKTYGGKEGEDVINSVIETDDKSLMLIGKTNSIDFEENLKGDYDLLLMKLDEQGELIWKKNYGGSNYDIGIDIDKDKEGNFYLGGYTGSVDGDIISTKGKSEFWALKVNDLGEIIWTQTYGRDKDEVLTDMQLSMDGGLLLYGSSNSVDTIYLPPNQGGGVIKNHGWLLKTDKFGKQLWDYLYDHERDEPYQVVEDKKGEISITGFTNVYRDVYPPRYFWICKIDKNGQLIWEKPNRIDGRDYNIELELDENDNYYVVSIVVYTPPGHYKLLTKYSDEGVKLWDKKIYSTGAHNGLVKTHDNGLAIVSGVKNRELEQKDLVLIKISNEQLYELGYSDLFEIASSKPYFTIDEIVFDTTYIGELRDTIISNILCNDGVAPIDILDYKFTSEYNGFKLDSVFNGSIIEPDKCKDLKFSFSSNLLNTWYSVFYVNYSFGQSPDNVIFKATVVDKKLENKVDWFRFGQVFVGQEVEKKYINLRNYSQYPIKVNLEHNYNSENDIVLNNGVSEFTIDGESYYQVPIEYKAKVQKKDTMTLRIYYDDTVAINPVYILAESVFDPNTSVNDYLDFSSTIDLSPNPASEQLNIDITTGVQGTMKLELVATDGRVIYTDEWTQSTKSKQMQINTMNIPSGLYQVRLITPYDAITKSVIVVE